MKLTAKNYLALHSEIDKLESDIYYGRRAGEFDAIKEKELAAAKLRTELESFKHVYVTYCIGCRRYYESAVKIGKSYFNGSDKLTKSRGYWDVTEIPEITEDMMDRMVADAHYY